MGGKMIIKPALGRPQVLASAGRTSSFAIRMHQFTPIQASFGGLKYSITRNINVKKI